MSVHGKGVAALLANRGDHMKESMGVGATPGTIPLPVPTPSGQYDGTGRDRDALVVNLDRLAPDPDQPRKTFPDESIVEMMESMERNGQLQPLRIRWSPEMGMWVIIDGERRFRAAKRLGKVNIQCVEDKRALTPDQILEAQLVANCVREDVPPVEAAAAMARLMEMRGTSIRELAGYLQVSHSKVQAAIELDAVQAPIKGMVAAGDIAPSVAVAAARAPVEDQVRLAERARDEKLTKLQTAEEARVLKAAKESKPAEQGGLAKPSKSRGPAPKYPKVKIAAGKVTVEPTRILVELRKEGTPESMADLLREIADQLSPTGTMRQDEAA